MSCGVGCRPGLDPALLWLRRKPAAAALIRPLAWELAYASGVALKSKKKKKINKDLLYSIGNSTQYSVIIYMGKDHIYIIHMNHYESLCCTSETNTTL